MAEVSSRQRIYTLSLLVVVYAISHVDWQIVAILQEPIKQAFQISDTQLGLLTGVSFALFYATLAIPMGIWADRHNRRNLIAFSIALWSGMTALCGAAVQFWQLMLARIGVAVGEAGSNPPSHAIISDLYPARDRGTAMAIFGIGVNIGIMFGYLIGGWVNDWLNWRWAFFIAGIPGLAVALLVRLTMKEPMRGQADKLETKTSTAPAFRTVAITMCKDSAIRQLMACTALLSMAGYAGVAWLPVYFQRVHGFSTGETGTFLALIIGLGGAAGTFMGGYFADRLAVISQGWRAWIICFTVSLAIPLAYMAYTATDPSHAIYWIILPASLGGAYIGTNFAILQSLAPVRMRALMAAINLFVLNILGLGLGPLFVGIVSDWAQPHYGVDSLRYGLLTTLPMLAWGLIHQLRLGFLLHGRLAKQART